MTLTPYFIYGAEGRSRTDTGLPPQDFESSASTSFTTSAFSLPKVIISPRKEQPQRTAGGNRSYLSCAQQLLGMKPEVSYLPHLLRGGLLGLQPFGAMAYAGPNRATQRRIVSYDTSMPRSARRSFTSRKLSVNRQYSQTAFCTMAGGKWQYR